MENVLESYLEYLNEDVEEAKVRLWVYLAYTIIVLVLYIWGLYLSSKRNRKLESIIKKITGNDYYVRVLKDDSPNAFCFGGIGKSIFITTKLLEICNEREIISVMLHEAGHVINLDSIKNLGIGSVSGGSAFFIFKKTLEYVLNSSDSKVKVILLGVCGVIFSYILWKFPGIYIGRIHEYRADRYAAEYGYGKDLSSALNKLEKWVQKQKKKEGYTKVDEFFDKISRIMDEHPETKKRMERLLEDSKFFDAMLKNDKKELMIVAKKHMLQVA